MNLEQITKHRFHGRRKGKTLTDYRQSLLSDVFPDYKIDLHNPLKAFNGKNEIWLEIGFGNGEHLSLISQTRPNIGLIGCEPFMNGIAALLASLDQPVDNLKLWDDNARLLMDEIPDASLDRIYLLNPDPWPKLKHHKRRFIQDESVSEIARLLKPNGLFIMSTDVAELSQWMHSHTARNQNLIDCSDVKNGWLTPPADWTIDKTRYMKKGLGGSDIYWLIFQKKT